MNTRISMMGTGVALLVVAGGLVIGSGCQTAVPVENPPLVVAPPKPTPPVLPPAGALNPAVEDKVALNVMVVATGADADSTALANRLAAALKSKLTEGGYRLADKIGADVIVELSATAREFDRSGNYLLLEGEASVKAKRATDGKLLGEQAYTAKGDRKLGAVAALQSLAGKFGTGPAEWTAKTVTAETAGLGVSALRVRCSGDWQEGKVPAYAEMFLAKAQAQPGMVRCIIVAHDYGQRVITFRMVYFKDKFPDGVYTRLYAIPELRLRPGVKIP